MYVSKGKYNILAYIIVVKTLQQQAKGHPLSKLLWEVRLPSSEYIV